MWIIVELDGKSYVSDKDRSLMHTTGLQSVKAIYLMLFNVEAFVVDVVFLINR